MSKDVKLPKVVSYSFDYYIEPDKEYFSSNGVLTIKNDSVNKNKKLSLLLYHGLKVKCVSVETDENVRFTQEIVSFPEYEEFKVNHISIDLTEYLEVNEETTLYIEYEGVLKGYSSIMQYVKDSINEEFSILRSDCLAYPIIAYPSYESYMESHYSPFSYKVNVSVPKKYTVGCGGLLKDIQKKNDRKIFTYERLKPTRLYNRFDICISEYSLTKDGNRNFNIFAFLKDKEIAEKKVMLELRKIYDYYRRIFGDYENDDSFTIIEVKEGYGCQAGDNYVLIEEPAFDDKNTNFTHLYHEIGHIWNANVKLYYEQRSRFFDEAFACYYEVLAIREFLGEEEAKEKMESYKEQFIMNVKHSKKNFDTPISDYGKYEIGYNSYSKGPWLLYVLHNIVGDEKFYDIIKTFLRENKGKQVTFKDFENTCAKVSELNLDKFFEQWLYGKESSSYLYNNSSVFFMVEKARQG